MSINFQVALNATKNIKAKLALEREDKIQVVMINLYHTDNVIFNTSKFMKELLKNQQNVRFSGAGASHQNGASERAIKTLVTVESAIFMQAWMVCTRTHYPLILVNVNGVCYMDIKLNP